MKVNMEKRDKTAGAGDLVSIRYELPYGKYVQYFLVTEHKYYPLIDMNGKLFSSESHPAVAFKSNNYEIIARNNEIELRRFR